MSDVRVYSQKTEYEGNSRYRLLTSNINFIGFLEDIESQKRDQERQKKRLHLQKTVNIYRIKYLRNIFLKVLARYKPC